MAIEATVNGSAESVGLASAGLGRGMRRHTVTAATSQDALEACSKMRCTDHPGSACTARSTRSLETGVRWRSDRCSWPSSLMLKCAASYPSGFWDRGLNDTLGLADTIEIALQDLAPVAHCPAACQDERGQFPRIFGRVWIYTPPLLPSCL